MVGIPSENGKQHLKSAGPGHRSFPASASLSESERASKGRTANSPARALTGPATVSAGTACRLGTALDILGVPGAEPGCGLSTSAGAGGSRDADARGTVDRAGIVDGSAGAGGEEQARGDKRELHFCAVTRCAFLKKRNGLRGSFIPPHHQ